MQMKMDDRSIAALRPSTRTKVYDTHTKGLVLRIGGRSRQWYFVYRNGGIQEWLPLGQYPAVKLKVARDLAEAHRLSLDVNGIDPAAERRKQATAPEPPPAAAPFTFKDFVPVFLQFQKGRGVKEWQDQEGKINRYLLPAWGTLPLKDITRRHVHEVLDTVQGRGLTTGVNRVQSVISRMFTVAVDRQLIDAHPASRVIKRFPEHPGERTLTEDELRTLWTGLDAKPGPASDAMKLRLLLGQRGGEIAGMRRDELDLNVPVWYMPRPRTKNKEPHAVALPPTALAIVKARLDSLPKDEPRIFPGFTLQSDDHKDLASLRGGADYEWKDLRRTMSTALAELGFDVTVIDLVTNHKRAGVTGKHYDKYKYLPEIKAALFAWDKEVQRILRNEPKKKSKVLPMRGRR